MKNIALLTSTPKGAELKKRLLSVAEFRGHVLIESYRNRWTHEPTFVPFTDITHYFNDDGKELGMIGFPDSSVETVLLHDPPRVWAATFLNRSQIRINPWKGS